MSINLKEFLSLVPVCEPTATVASVLRMLSQDQGERIVVVNQQQHPLGTINLKFLLNRLFSFLEEGRGDRSSFLEQPIDRLSLSAIEPLEILPIQWNQFLPQLSTTRPWALVDSTGAFLGLLDPWRLLKFIGGQESRDKGTKPKNLSLSLLVELLEHLPLPLKLQTVSGEVLTQNRAWRSQVEAIELVPPMWEEIEENSVIPYCAVAHVLYQDGQPRAIASSPMCPIASTVILNKLTPLTFEEETPYLPTSDSERVWQFTQLPLNLPLSEPSSSLVLVLATDITDQRLVAEELAVKNANLVQLNRLKDEFLSCISHELKTPLTAVLGLSSLLKDQLLGELNERQSRYAQLIHKSGRQLMNVVNDILDLTRMETGQIELTLEPIKIRAVCDRAYQQALQHQDDSAAEKKFTLYIEPGLDMAIADEMRLRQMLAHLLSNALKFTEIDGEVGLKIALWEGWIAFTVWDTGIGIPAQKEHLIFQKFQQLENPLTRRYKGTGLGLVLTQHLARLHGGDVSFISKEGQGSQFTLLLPPRPSLSELEMECVLPLLALNPPQSRSSRLVLIVEAVAHSINTLTEQLGRLGYWVVVARSGTEALEKARQLQPGAILLNPLLPMLSGWDVLTLLKTDAQTQGIPVLMMVTQAEKAQAFQNHADEFLKLPVQIEDLQSSLTRLIQPQCQIGTNLTILHLDSDFGDIHFAALLNSEASTLNCRVLEADNLEQAEVLARVWHPDVLLLDGTNLENPSGYLYQLSLLPQLAALPLVTLDVRTTQAANQVLGLTVYPCLIPYAKTSDDRHSSSITALLQVIEVAAGLSRRSSVLLVDGMVVDNNLESSSDRPFSPRDLKSEEWLQSLVHYLQSAGLKSAIAHSWMEVCRQLQHHSVDLLLIHLGEVQSDSVLSNLRYLAQLPIKPPILVLDRRLPGFSSDSEFDVELESLLNLFNHQTLGKSSTSMAALLQVMNQMLNNSKR